jgi:hypothetical protein
MTENNSDLVKIKIKIDPSKKVTIDFKDGGSYDFTPKYIVQTGEINKDPIHKYFVKEGFSEPAIEEAVWYYRDKLLKHLSDLVGKNKESKDNDIKSIFKQPFFINMELKKDEEMKFSSELRNWDKLIELDFLDIEKPMGPKPKFKYIKATGLMYKSVASSLRQIADVL